MSDAQVKQLRLFSVFIAGDRCSDQSAAAD